MSTYTAPTATPVIGNIPSASPAPVQPVAPSPTSYAPSVAPATVAPAPVAAPIAPAPVAAPVAPAAPPAAPAAVTPIAPAPVAAPVAPAPAAASPATPPIVAIPSAPPAVGSIGGSTPVQSAGQRTANYEPPTASIPDAPDSPGKWRPQYSKDRKSYVVPGIDGIRQTDTLTRATTHAKLLGDSSTLADWQVRGAVLGLARNPELLETLNLGDAKHLSELDFSGRRAISWVAKQASRRVGGDDGSDFGTKLHGYLQAILEGTVTMEQVPEILRPYLTVAFESMRRHKLSFVSGMTERTVFIPATGMVGTFDFMVMTEDGTLAIGDLKTSNSIDYSWLSIAVQLAQYASSTLMLSWDGSHWEPMPAVSQVMAKVLSIPKDSPTPTSRVYSVNLELGLEMVQMANRVKAVTASARRASNTPELYGVTTPMEACRLNGGDELLAWADGDEIPLTSVPSGNGTCA